MVKLSVQMTDDLSLKHNVMVGVG